MMAPIWAPAWMRAFIAPLRATRRTRIISTCASRDFGMPLARPRLDSAGCGPGVERVGLAVAAAHGAVGPVNLDDGQAVAGQEPQQAGTETARAFHSDLVNGAEGLGPGRQPGIATGGGRKAGCFQQPPGLVEDRGNVHISVGIDADRHRLLIVHGHPLRLEDR